MRAFTIVSLAAPGIPVPFVSATVDCAGTSVRPQAVHLGMKVRLALTPVGTDAAGTEAVSFGFEPRS